MHNNTQKTKTSQYKQQKQNEKTLKTLQTPTFSLRIQVHRKRGVERL